MALCQQFNAYRAFVALLPGDILARYFRKAGNEVLYVSGSDCHGTPITIRAEILGVSPEKVSEHYDNEFRKTLKIYLLHTTYTQIQQQIFTQ